MNPIIRLERIEFYNEQIQKGIEAIHYYQTNDDLSYGVRSKAS